MTGLDPMQLEPGLWPFLIATVVKMLLIFTIYMVVVAYTTLAERKVSAWIQDRHGPNRVGPWGLFQVLADGVKNFLKEETMPVRSTSRSSCWHRRWRSPARSWPGR